MNDKSDLIKTYDRAVFKGQIHSITTDQELVKALSLIKESNIVGFDTETKPSFKKGEFYHVALLQLATDEHALLIRLHYFKDYSPIVQFFEDESITKVGLAIRDDIKALQKLFHFTPKGFIELTDIAKKKNIKNMGLKGMSEEVLDLTLSKRAKLSNWEARDLKNDQIQYAATDAWISRVLYQNLLSV